MTQSEATPPIFSDHNEALNAAKNALTRRREVDDQARSLHNERTAASAQVQKAGSELRRLEGLIGKRGATQVELHTVGQRSAAQKMLTAAENELGRIDDAIVNAVDAGATIDPELEATENALRTERNIIASDAIVAIDSELEAIAGRLELLLAAVYLVETGLEQPLVNLDKTVISRATGEALILDSEVLRTRDNLRLLQRETEAGSEFPALAAAGQALRSSKALLANLQTERARIQRERIAAQKEDSRLRFESRPDETHHYLPEQQPRPPAPPARFSPNHYGALNNHTDAEVRRLPDSSPDAAA